MSGLAVPDDRALLKAHVSGDPQAFGELVRRHRDRLWAVALRTMADREEAADALQDALVSAFRNAAGYRGDAAVTTWLHRIVVNACLDRIRRRKARPAEALGDRDLPTRRDDHAVTETRIDVRAALDNLPEPQRLAIVLVDMEDLPVAEAAILLGVAEGTIKSRCSRGRAALALLLRPQPTAPDGNRGGGPHVASQESLADDVTGNVAGHTPMTGGGR
ncbi:MAG: RNA polymerase sigma factor SigM [Actinomycetales bacterium]|nr:RNA polymerase sigma factor SigM [Actinomycetales bacterium]